MRVDALVMMASASSLYNVWLAYTPFSSEHDSVLLPSDGFRSAGIGGSLRGGSVRYHALSSSEAVGVLDGQFFVTALERGDKKLRFSEVFPIRARGV